MDKFDERRGSQVIEYIFTNIYLSIYVCACLSIHLSIFHLFINCRCLHVSVFVRFMLLPAEKQYASITAKFRNRSNIFNAQISWLIMSSCRLIRIQACVNSEHKQWSSYLLFTNNLARHFWVCMTNANLFSQLIILSIICNRTKVVKFINLTYKSKLKGVKV